MWEPVYPLVLLILFTNTLSTTDSASEDYPHWVKFNPANETLPSDAIVGGYENETLYIARAPHAGSLTPGKYVPSTHKAIISWGWLSHVKAECEILRGRNYKWVPTTTDNIPEGAVVGGHVENSYEPLYVGRVFYKGQVTIPGKVEVSQKIMYFAYGDKEIKVKYFEILVKTSKPTPREYPHWVKYNRADSLLPADAIVGGYGGNQNETLYIARAPHEGSLTPGQYVPSTHQAIISSGSWSHVKTEFEILVGHNYTWIPTTVHYIPDGAVVGGYIEDSYEPLFVGRVHYLGQIIPGKVAVSHGVMHFGYKDREMDVTNFEILVFEFDDKIKEKPKITGEYNVTATIGQLVNIVCEVTEGVPKPLISWQFRAKSQSKFVSIPGSIRALNMYNVNATDEGTYKCIATNDVGKDEHLTELIVQKSTNSTYDANPHWVQFNPASEELPDDAIVGGYQNETLYIARATHEGLLTFGMYVPSTHKAYVTWSSDAHSKNVFEILRGDNYVWVPTTTDYIPDNSFAGGYIENTYESLYVCKANYSGHVMPGKVAVSHGVCYIAYRGKTVPVRNFEILVVPEKRGPRITGKDRETVVEGQSVNIECRVTEGIPEPTISWEYKAKSGDKFVPIPGSDNVLHISRANKTDAGTYMCVAANDLGYSTHRTELIVQTVLDDYGIINELEPFRHMQGSIFRLKCGYGDPSETISWFHNGVSTETKGEYYVLENLNMSFDGYNYTCRVSRGDVTKVNTFVMTVSPLQFTLDLQDPIILDLTEKEDYELNCDFGANAPANISWTFNGKLMENQKSSRLTFVGNWGTYTCKVTNIYGTIQRSFNVTSSKCIIPREPKYVNTTPIILTAMSDYTTDYMKVEPGQILTFACPDFENETNHFQMFPLRHEIKAHCVKEDQFIIKDKSYKLSDLVCANEVHAAVVKKHQKCWTNNNNSELLGVGYGFSETFEVCFDTANNIPLYIPGKISKWNHDGDVTYQWHKYRALGAHRDTSTCDNAASTCCYTKAQLVNARDFSAGIPQRTSFIDPLNAVMLWRPCNLLLTPWEVMESSIRLMTAFADEFRVWSGTYMPQNINGTIIPRILWKATEAQLAIIYINGPSPSKEDILCTNKCGTSPPWPYEYRKYIYCCDLEEFLLRFGLDATNVGEPSPGGIFYNARR